MNTVKIDRKNTKMTAHRGLSGLETENTAAAFIAAGQRSYFGIETDIRKTSDGFYVCSHDGDTARISGKDIKVSESTLSQLKEVQYNDRVTGMPCDYLRMPLLSDYIRICKKYGKHCITELKEDFSKEELNEIICEFEKEDYLSSVTFISFYFNVLVKLKEILPDIRVQFLTGDYSAELIERLKKYGMDLDIRHDVLDKEKIDELHENGIEINCWTVDGKERAEQLAAWGVDHITTNIAE